MITVVPAFESMVAEVFAVLALNRTKASRKLHRKDQRTKNRKRCFGKLE